ncbi:Acetyltransferase (isoleucine patch superfamily) [Geosmithia morbida]|uniref:Acetyltransferase (Isoleucine patch superfamily) n=1 Tax=Geosmithia morbida TaxID=1094350 RepID=A0A9P5D675_9HYPO|nr:Acetyltransferase (isoleucine patch superfamily) [Geosmithia morbida]KAF4125326.1 Acetyltransferase (isoleucine patch superfamily) [Geosmithia morbida]
MQKIESVCGKGIFDLNETTEKLYLRLMEAKIGKGVKLNRVSLGECDLLDIRDGAALDKCVCRPFAAEGNISMYLGRIVIGENALVSVASIVAAGTEVLPNTCIGPNTSNWELGDADENNRDLASSAAAKPHWLLTLLFTCPLGVATWFLSRSLDARSLGNDTRIVYHYFSLILGTFCAPYIFFGFMIVIKFILDLIFEDLPRGSSKSMGTVNTWLAGLIETLLPAPRLHSMTELFGQHYEATSTAVRMLVGKVGRRVYWLGTGPAIRYYHLLDIGNDVVFGSRSHLITSDGYWSEQVKIGDGAMTADRVCLLPGVSIGEGAIMGSGTATHRGKSYDAYGTYIGSKGGDAVCLSTGGTVEREKNRLDPKTPEKQRVSLDMSSTSESNSTSPFGHVFYMKQAPYHVMGPWAIFGYSAFIIEKLRRNCYGGQGILGLLIGNHWVVLYFKALGADIGDNCALFSNGRPSRLLSGARMNNDSCLLEHTLIMGGDTVEEKWTMQGWPAERCTGSRVKN